ncbi:hypothetical protein SI65_00608 [Aspergillus cristatus]|uniref:Uncharacterized protein n=1 Tax=Aspergillus cristatus TaxID=573508 RepID=A0A1E3BPZ0_ASPCR|nr:hypothetical protein SI65_00608 [Aspergillus cristatus]
MAADPTCEAPQPSRTNYRGTAGLFSLETFEQSIVPRKRSPRQGNGLTTTAHSNPEFAKTEDNNGRVTTKEVRRRYRRSSMTKMSFRNRMRSSTKSQSSTGSTRAAPPATPTRTWTAVVAAGSKPVRQLDHQRPDKDQNCARISTQ